MLMLECKKSSAEWLVAWMARCTSGCQSRSLWGNMQMQGALADVRAGWSWLCREHSDVVRGFSPGFPSSSSHLWSSGLITPMSLSCASVRFHCWPFMPFNSLMVLVCMKQGSLMFRLCHNGSPVYYIFSIIIQNKSVWVIVSAVIPVS